MPAKGTTSTHCKRGHPRISENQYPSQRKGPKCRLCQVLRRKERKAAGVDWTKTENGKRGVKYVGIKCRYGLTKEQYQQLLEKQQGRCPICNVNLDSSRKTLIPQVDHVHDETKRIRGLLCGSCNMAIGLLKEDPNVFTNAINYLKETQ